MEETQVKETESVKRSRHITIRAKLMVAFLVVFLIPVLAMLYLLSRRMPASYDQLARVRVVSALEGIRSDFESLRADMERRAD